MGLNKGKLTIPYTLRNLARCIGVNSQDFGTLCESKTINWWAKYKPVRSPRKHYLDRTEDKMENLNPEVDSFKKRGFGIVAEMKHLDNPSSVLSDAISKNYGWSYEQPRGKNNPSGEEWYRTFDFDGYINYAVCPIYAHWHQYNITPTLNFGAEPNLPEGNLQIGDLVTITGWNSSLDATNHGIYGAGYGIIIKTDRSDTPIHIEPLDDKENLRFPIVNESYIEGEDIDPNILSYQRYEIDIKEYVPNFPKNPGNCIACVYIAKRNDPMYGYLLPVPAVEKFYAYGGIEDIPGKTFIAVSDMGLKVTGAKWSMQPSIRCIYPFQGTDSRLYTLFSRIYYTLNGGAEKIDNSFSWEIPESFGNSENETITLDIASIEDPIFRNVTSIELLHIDSKGNLKVIDEYIKPVEE